MTYLRLKQHLKHYAWVRVLWRLFHSVRTEKRVSWGNDYPDKVFYVIGTDDGIGGAWWLIQRVLMHIAYATDNGYIPVVDMKNYRTQYVRTDEQGTYNLWERFFQQPAGYSLQDIASAQHVVINSSGGSPSISYNLNLGNSFFDDEDKIFLFRNLCSRYLLYQKSFESYLKEQEQKIVGKRLVGVLCRGTDYVVNKPQGHPVQPEPAEIIECVQSVLHEYHCDGVFIATEDRDVLSLFQSHFGDRLYYVNQYRISQTELTGDKWLAEMKGEKRLDLNDDFASYFSATYLLSQCPFFVAGRTCGSMGVMMLSKGFEYCKIYNLGVY